MNFGVLSDHFDGAGAKYLAEVEVNRFLSHQHEFQGIGSFREFLGVTPGQVKFQATFYWLDDADDDNPLYIESTCTWNDVRRNQPNRSAEYRLYYPAHTEPIVHRAVAGDLLVIAKTKEQKLLIILSPAGSTAAQQLLWLFGLNPAGNQADARAIQTDFNRQLGIGARSILDDLGIELVEPAPESFGLLIERQGTNFPTAREFSQFARDNIESPNPLEAPDEALIAWMDHEEALFRHMERHIVEERLKRGFEKDGTIDVDSATAFFLSVHNRRKSRAGLALGNHLERVIDAHGIRYTREARTEGAKRPDFLFPGQSEYADASYQESLLTMLGAKRTCKDRWRQVLSEAERIENKHLLTLQPSISVPQTDEMRSSNLQLVVPRPLFSTYQRAQQDWLMDLAGFIELVKSRQKV